MADLALKPLNIEKTGDDAPVRTLFGFVWRMSGRHQISLCLLAALVASLSMVPLELQRRIVNSAIELGSLDMLLYLGGIYLAVILLQSGLKYLLRIYQGWLSESAIRYCREHLSRIHECRKETTSQNGGGRAVSVIGSEIDQVGGFVGDGFSEPVVHGGMLIAIFGYMVVVEPLIAGISLIFFVPQIIIVPLIQRLINRQVERRIGYLREVADDLADSEQEEGAELLTDRYKGRLDSIYGNRMKTFLLKFASKGIVNVLNALPPLCVLVVGGYMVIQGETTIGIVVAFISGFERMANPLRQLIAYYRLAAQTQVKHEKIAQWM